MSSWADVVWGYRWIVFVFLALFFFWVWAKYMSQETIKLMGKSLTRRDMRHLAHFGMVIIIIYGCKQYLFYEVKTFFYLALGIFTFIGAIIWYMAEKKQDIWILENTIQGEEMYNLGVLDKRVAGQSGIRLYRMPPHVYEAKTHEGELNNIYWKKGRMVMTDLYDGKTFYHPEHPDLHNVNFYQAQAFWLNFKKTYPEVALKMLELTWLREWWLVDALGQVEQKSFMALAEGRMQHKVPFDIAMTRKQHYDKLKKEQTLDLSAQEIIKGRDDKPEDKEKDKKKSLADLEGLLEDSP